MDSKRKLVQTQSLYIDELNFINPCMHSGIMRDVA